MRIKILSVGKENTKEYESAIFDFTSRVQHYSKIEWIYIKPTKLISAPFDIQKEEEGERILKMVQDSDFVVLLDEAGKNISSVEHSNILSRCLNESVENVVYVIGGSFGVSPDVKKRANFIWSLSHLVFPHQLARLIVSEQIYRAFTIIKGEKYHHQ